MDIRQLQYFSMVYETKNMHHSADMLFISRQALKQMIHTLEKEIGQPLFINDKNKLRATKAADEIYEYSRDAVASFDEFQNKLNNQFGKSKHSITIHCGIQHSYFSFLLQHQKTRVREPQASCFPHTINMEYSTGTTYDLKQRVTHGALDCAYIITNEEDSSANQLLDYRKIWGGGGVFVKCSDPLASREVIGIEDFDGLSLATQGSGFDIHEYIIQRCRVAGVKPKIVFQSFDFVDILSLVWIRGAATYGFVDDSATSSFTDLTCVPFDSSFVNWSVCLITKKGHMDYIAEMLIKHGDNLGRSKEA